MRSRNTGLRTVDVARRAGCSVQQVRNLEQQGVLPPAARTRAGYRTYADAHLHAALAYRWLSVGIGPAEAKTVLRAAHSLPMSELLALLDEAHARLHSERRELQVAREAVAAISAEPIDDPRRTDAMTVSMLADALGIPASTLRHWDAEGLVVPAREPGGGRARSYSPADVRDARIVHQLRQAGYRIAPLRQLMPLLRRGRRREDVDAALRVRQDSVTTRSRALLQGAAALDAALGAAQPAAGAGEESVVASRAYQ